MRQMQDAGRGGLEKLSGLRDSTQQTRTAKRQKLMLYAIIWLSGVAIGYAMHDHWRAATIRNHKDTPLSGED